MVLSQWWFKHSPLDLTQLSEYRLRFCCFHKLLSVKVNYLLNFEDGESVSCFVTWGSQNTKQPMDAAFSELGCTLSPKFLCNFCSQPYVSKQEEISPICDLKEISGPSVGLGLNRNLTSHLSSMPHMSLITTDERTATHPTYHLLIQKWAFCDTYTTLKWNKYIYQHMWKTECIYKARRNKWLQSLFSLPQIWVLTAFLQLLSCVSFTWDLQFYIIKQGCKMVCWCSQLWASTMEQQWNKCELTMEQ